MKKKNNNIIIITELKRCVVSLILRIFTLVTGYYIANNIFLLIFTLQFNFVCNEHVDKKKNKFIGKKKELELLFYFSFLLLLYKINNTVVVRRIDFSFSIFNHKSCRWHVNYKPFNIPFFLYREIFFSQNTPQFSSVFLFYNALLHSSSL